MKASLEAIAKQGSDIELRITKYYQQLNSGMKELEADGVKTYEHDAWISAAGKALLKNVGQESGEYQEWETIDKEQSSNPNKGLGNILYYFRQRVACIQSAAILAAPEPVPPARHITVRDIVNPVGPIIFGDNNKTEGNYAINSAEELLNSYDLSALLSELAVLRAEMGVKSREDADSAISLGNVANAEKALKKGEKSRALEYLKAAGTWAFDSATKIGVSLTTELLKKILWPSPGP